MFPAYKSGQFTINVNLDKPEILEKFNPWVFFSHYRYA